MNVGYPSARYEFHTLADEGSALPRCLGEDIYGVCVVEGGVDEYYVKET